MTFAPCTLPLIPSFLAFIAGSVHPSEKRIMRAAILYVLGFSVVFIFLGTLFGALSAMFFEYRHITLRIGGVLILFFGTVLIGAQDAPLIQKIFRNRSFPLMRYIHPHTAFGAFVYGAIFALGWTPCVGPVLGSVLILATTGSTALEGALLLAVFALGMSLPFLTIAYLTHVAHRSIRALYAYTPLISKVSGALLIVLGVLMITDTLYLWNDAVITVATWLHLVAP